MQITEVHEARSQGREVMIELSAHMKRPGHIERIVPIKRDRLTGRPILGPAKDLGQQRFYGTTGSAVVVVRLRDAERPYLVWPRQVLRLTPEQYAERQEAARAERVRATQALYDTQEQARRVANLLANEGVTVQVTGSGGLTVPASSIQALARLLDGAGR